MKSIKNIFFITSCLISSSFAQAQSIEQIEQLRINTYNSCLVQAEKKETSVEKMNDYIISCMNSSGFSIKAPQQQSPLSKAEKEKIENEIIQHRLKITYECSTKHQTEHEIIACLERSQ